MSTLKWIVNWFELNSDLSREEIEKNLQENYLTRGWIDSFKFITFITEIEDKFKITFSTDEFENRAFATVDGLNKIIEARIEKEL